jgi:hypothetical protein
LKRVDLAGFQRIGHSGLQPFQSQRADRPANQPSQIDADRSCHMSNLALLALAQNNAQPHAFLWRGPLPTVLWGCAELLVSLV